MLVSFGTNTCPSAGPSQGYTQTFECPRLQVMLDAGRCTRLDDSGLVTCPDLSPQQTSALCNEEQIF